MPDGEAAGAGVPDGEATGAAAGVTSDGSGGNGLVWLCLLTSPRCSTAWALPAGAFLLAPFFLFPLVQSGVTSWQLSGQDWMSVAICSGVAPGQPSVHLMVSNLLGFGVVALAQRAHVHLLHAHRPTPWLLLLITCS